MRIATRWKSRGIWIGKSTIYYEKLQLSILDGQSSMAPSIALIVRIARARRSESPFGGTRSVEYAKVHLSRAVYTAFADRLARDMSPNNAPRAQPVPGASRCSSVK